MNFCFTSFGQLFTGTFLWSWTSELWHFTFWVFLGVSGTHHSGFFSQIFKVFTCIQFKNKLISPIFSDMFWPNFTNNPCKTTTGIPSKKYTNFIVAPHTWSVCEICAKHRRTKIMCFFKRLSMLSNLPKTTENLDFLMFFGQSVLYYLMLFLSNFLSRTTVIFWCVPHVGKCLSKSKQTCLLEFTIIY